MSRNVFLSLALAAALLLAGAGWWAVNEHYATLAGRALQHTTLVHGGSRLAPGSQAALRVVVRNGVDGAPLPGAAVRVALRPAAGGDAVTLYTGQAGEQGIADVAFRVPDDTPAESVLVVETNSPAGSDHVEQPVQVTRDYRVLLTTDKPLYQPGQVMHLRALALSSFDLQPAAGRPLTLTVADGKGNRVFRVMPAASEFGVVSADFQLAGEVNTGLYKITATLGDTTSEKTVTVEHYVLPKFRVTVTTERAYYRPGERVRGTLRAEYFYGKPVAGAAARLSGYTFDVQRNDVLQLEEPTGANGDCAFEFDLPGYIAGSDLENGLARFYLQAEVTDLAAHTETADLSLPVSQNELLIDAIPESGQLHPGVENILYVLTSYPDGSPADTEITVELPGSNPLSALSGPYGLAEVRFTPSGPGDRYTVRAADASGHRVQRAFQFVAGTGESADAVLLRPSRAVARVGETLTMTVFTGAPQGTVYLDLIRDGQTMSTRAVPVTDGRAEVAVDLTPDLAGTLELHAYKVLASSTIVRDTRLVIVDRAADLSVAVAADREVYRPGDTAGLDFRVTGADGAGSQGVLGLAIVDEAVFALAEQDPGFARLYFLLQQEILQPRVEIHGFEVPRLMTESAAAEPVLQAARERAGHAALARVALAGGLTFQVNTGVEKQEQANAVRYNFQRGVTRLATWPAGLLPLGILACAGWIVTHPEGSRRAQTWLVALTALYALVLAYLLFGPISAANTLASTQGFGVCGAFLLVPFAYVLLAMGRADLPGNSLWLALLVGGAFLCIVLTLAACSPTPTAAPRAGAPAATGAPVVATATAGEGAPAQAGAAPRLRQYFPETMLWLPEATTDVNGTLHLDVPLADSITTWRITALASTRDGRLGSANAGLRVFQDFFVDLDLPAALTVGDEVTVPVGVFNYLPAGQTVRLELAPAEWFELLDEGVKELTVGPNDIGVVYFRLRARAFGPQALKVTAYGSAMSDAIQREVRVFPDGKPITSVQSDLLSAGQTATAMVPIPAAAIAGTQAVTVKIYPGMVSQVVEGLDSLLRMPSGCFEQTSSTTYPNVLVLDYLRATNQASPETRMKAEEYINLGYQRLASFEVKTSGGFSLFGNEPADRMLTAYGLQEFSDMARVYDVDPALLERAAKWLLAQQQPDGAWLNDQGLVHESTWQRLKNDRLPVTAYISWSLLAAGYAEDAQVQRGVAYVREHTSEAEDAYVLALVANTLVADDLARGGRITPGTGDVLDRLAGLAERANGTAAWHSDVATFVGAKGATGSIETTALAALALQRTERHPDLANQALAWLIQQKDSYGTWHTTQATVLALKALIESVRIGGERPDATVTIGLSGGEAHTLRITPENFDVVQQVTFTDVSSGTEYAITIAAAGEGHLMYQVSGSYYLPWNMAAATATGSEAVSVAVAYDRTQLSVDDTVEVRVTVTLNQPGTAQQALIDLGLPPGFELQAEDLAARVAHDRDRGTSDTGPRIERYEVTGRQILVYATGLTQETPLAFSYRLKAKFPLAAQAPASSAYDYYNPEVSGESAPQMLVVAP